jgi:hypothetical protein
MVVVALPRPDDLHTAPERAALALLDAALAVARAALLAENPDVATLGDPEYGLDPPLTCILAACIVERGDALHDLVASYLAAVDDLDRDDFDLPF